MEIGHLRASLLTKPEVDIKLLKDNEGFMQVCQPMTHLWHC